MRRFGQAICILLIAIGSGLFSFGSFLEPRADFTNVAEVARQIDPYRSREEHFTASICRGVGIGCLTLGSLGLVVPWINLLVSKVRVMDRSPSVSPIPANDPISSVIVQPLPRNQEPTP